MLLTKKIRLATVLLIKELIHYYETICNRKSSLGWNVNTGMLTKTNSVVLDICTHLFCWFQNLWSFIRKYLQLYYMNAHHGKEFIILFHQKIMKHDCKMHENTSENEWKILIVFVIVILLNQKFYMNTKNKIIHWVFANHKKRFWQ